MKKTKSSTSTGVKRQVAHSTVKIFSNLMRKRLRFELLKTTLIALRGYRGREGYNLEECNSQFDGMDLNLEPVP